MTTLCIIPAHLDSKRFPGKVLADIEGKTMLERVLERTRRAKLIDQIVVGLDLDDAALCYWCDKHNIAWFHGTHTKKDLLTLFYQTAEACTASTIVRITSDCPLIDPGIVDTVVSLHQQTGLDYTSNIWPKRTFPDGLDVEVFSFDLLRKAHENAHLLEDREHVSPWMHSDKKTRYASLTHIEDLSHLRWTVDTPEDLDFVRRVYRDLKEPFGMKEILALQHNP